MDYKSLMGYGGKNKVTKEKPQPKTNKILESVKKEFLKDSDTHSTCPWKGQASYYSILVDGELNKDAAWYYPDPKSAASVIKDRIAFWKGVKVT